MNHSRQNNITSSQDLINKIREHKTQNSIRNKKEHPFTKIQLWKFFQVEFKNMFGYDFIYNHEIERNIETLFYYFLEDEKFFELENLHADISAPSFEKGLFLIGSVGVGKTHVMRVFEKIFSIYKPHRFKIISTEDVVNGYESCQAPMDKQHFYQRMHAGTVLFDDLGAEPVANNYGQRDVMVSILQKRYHDNKKTHLTYNPMNGTDKCIDSSLLELEKRYGSRVFDRFFDMFNIIEFSGKSMRR